MKDRDYLINRVTTANGAQLVAILYEELIEIFKDSIKVMDQDHPQELKEYMSKARDILAELMSTLEGTTEITANLRSIYLYVNRLMTEAVIQKNPARLEEAIKVLTPLYEGWRQLGEEVQVTSTPQQVATRITGLTYGKNQLNDYIIDDENKWKKG